jgi:hypothetical protein
LKDELKSESAREALDLTRVMLTVIIPELAEVFQKRSSFDNVDFAALLHASGVNIRFLYGSQSESILRSYFQVGFLDLCFGFGGFFFLFLYIYISLSIYIYILKIVVLNLIFAPSHVLAASCATVAHVRMPVTPFWTKWWLGINQSVI